MQASIYYFVMQESFPNFVIQAPFRQVLSNGLTLVHRPDFASPVVSLQLWVKTGSLHEGAYLGSGISHYIEHLVFKGTERRTGPMINRAIHALGGSINAYTTFDRTVYYIDVPAAAFDTALDLLTDLVFHAKLEADAIELERQVILREIDMGLDDPDQQLSQLLLRTAYIRHPYRFPIIGERSLFEAISVEDLRNYYRARYVPNNCVLAIAGAVESASCFAAVEKCCAALPMACLEPVLVDQEPPQLAQRSMRQHANYQVVRGAMAYKVPHLSHADAASLDALAFALGGGESSLLWQRLRNEKNCVYSIDCRNWNSGDPGLMWLSYLCDPDQRETVESSIDACIADVAHQGLPAEVLEKARRQAMSGEINSYKTMSGQAARLGLGEAILGNLEMGPVYLERLAAVGVEDLQRVCQQYLVSRSRSQACLGPIPQASNSNRTSASISSTDFECHTFSNGARLVHQCDPRLPKVHLRCVIKGGSSCELTGQRGITELLAELMTKDSGQRTAAEVADLVERIGGSFHAGCGHNTLFLALEVFPEDLSVAVDLLRDALLNLKIDRRTFETERAAQVSQIGEMADDILEYGICALRERFFGQHPLAVNSLGLAADLQRLDVAAVQAHHQRLVRAPNVVISLCGRFDVSEAIPMLSHLLEDELPTGGELDWPQATWEPHGGGAVESLTLERAQSVVLHAFPSVGIQHANRFVSELLNELFNGLSSRLFEAVREEKGLAYYVGASQVIGYEDAMFFFYAGTEPSQSADVLAEIDAEIKRVMQSGPTLEEFERCRTRLKAARAMGLQTIGARAMHAALQTVYGLPLESEATYAQRLDALQLSDLRTFAADQFKAAWATRIIVGPRISGRT